MVYPIDPHNFTTQYTLNTAFGSGDLGVITINPVEEFLSAPASVPLQITLVLMILLGLTGLAYIRRIS